MALRRRKTARSMSREAPHAHVVSRDARPVGPMAAPRRDVAAAPALRAAVEEPRAVDGVGPHPRGDVAVAHLGIERAEGKVA
eukprot:CAMPEP_0179340500 /NCGR_PEP_ID=MMETSP0797-20121207/69319_1 /TAXON_ID=47934 /ORGANISM="Dinophysis acuminata, Strain DAEP01" /LENGTH=81 /DNA_ID=CAMNT_0021054477 /DNA_START=36 /DNA_END=281 /DNA_ORIENTATION=-